MDRPARNSRIRLSQGLLFWREVGQGPTIVFLHGSWWSGEQWSDVSTIMSYSHHCLIPDLLGFGESERPPIHYSINLEVECLAEYLKFLRIRECVLVGHSLGGWVAATYATRYPEQVKGLVLLAPEGVSSDRLRGRWSGWRSLANSAPFVDWVLRLLLPVARIVGKREAIHQAIKLRAILRKSPKACQLLFQRRTAEIQSEWMQDRLSLIQCPILLLHGTQDSSMAIALTQLYASAPGVTVEQVEADCSMEPWRHRDPVPPRSELLADQWVDLSAPQSNPDTLSKAVVGPIKDFVKRLDD